MYPPAKCVVDWTRPCGACVAPGPQECPYAYLLDPDELATVVTAGLAHRPRTASPSLAGPPTGVTSRS